jgi:hypothetical protein
MEAYKVVSPMHLPDGLGKLKKLIHLVGRKIRDFRLVA